MAAGMSTRFVPLSLETPKALLCVKGEILIERQICQLREAGIQEIIIIVGYLKEKFEYLCERYGVVLIENPSYQIRNNHSSLYVAREFLKDTFICSGDNYFVENVFLEKEQRSYYSAVYAEGQTEEWCLETKPDGEICNVAIGGNDAWVMKGHAFFNKEFSDIMIPFLEEAYQNDEYRNKFWEEIYMEHMDELKMYIHPYKNGIIEEFDSIEELRKFDALYRNHSGSKILNDISKYFSCEEGELTGLYPLKEGGVVVGFGFQYQGAGYQYSFKTMEIQGESEDEKTK